MTGQQGDLDGSWKNSFSIFLKFVIAFIAYSVSLLVGHLSYF